MAIIADETIDTIDTIDKIVQEDLCLCFLHHN